MRTRSLSPVEPEPSETKERIIQGAIEVFSEYSVDMATMRMIAKEANVTLSLLVYHFQNKENIYQTVLDRVFELYEQRFRPVFEKVESKEKLPTDEAVEILVELIEITVEMLCRDSAVGHWKGKTILYECVYPSVHYEAYFQKHVNRFYRRWTKVVTAITGNDDQKTAYFQAVNIFGQIVGFRIQREMLKRSLEMDLFFAQDLKAIKKMVTDNAFFMLDVRR